VRGDAKLQKLLLEESSCLDAEPLGQLNTLEYIVCLLKNIIEVVLHNRAKYFCTTTALEKKVNTLTYWVPLVLPASMQTLHL
jgi:hypothetical protein